MARSTLALALLALALASAEMEAPAAPGTASSYSPVAQAKACPPGTHTNAQRSGCVSCKKGEHQPRPGQDACLFCAAGRYSSLVRSSACQLCDAGTFAEQLGSASCAGCPSGAYASARGATSCATCAESEYSTAQRDGCAACALSCPPGHVNAACGTRARTDTGALVSSAGTCTACPAGRFSLYGRGRTCAAAATCAAASGQWEQIAPTASSDRVCASHRVCSAPEYESAPPSAGADRQCKVRTRCPAGQYVRTPGTQATDNACAACPAGRHQPNAATLTTACDACPALFRANPAGTACWAAQCSHVRCVHEAHRCGMGRPNAAHHAYYGLFVATEQTNCDQGRTWTSVRVTHGGNHPAEGAGTDGGELKEGPCRHGHHCGMGVVSGDRKKCECAPRAVMRP